MATSTDVYTFHEYLSTGDENDKTHLFEGIITMQAPASLRHEELQTFLAILIGTFATEKQLGRVFGSHAAFKLKTHSAVEADLSLITRSC